MLRMAESSETNDSDSYLGLDSRREPEGCSEFAVEETDDSEDTSPNPDLDNYGGPTVGNLAAYIAVPSDFNGIPKRGHLIFDASFESGNLGRVDCVGDFEYDLFIRPDTCNPRYRVWFNFTVNNTSLGQRVIFNIVNFSKTKSLYRDGMSPLVKSTSRPKWQRIPSKNVFYYRCPDHRNNYVLSFPFAFDNEDDTYQFAYCYPYTFSRLQSHLDNIEKKRFEFFRREQLCLSVQKRRVDVLTITSKYNQNSVARKHIVFITGRVHPGMAHCLRLVTNKITLTTFSH